MDASRPTWTDSLTLDGARSEFKRQLVEEHLGGGIGLSELARRHDISRELLRT